MQLVVVAVGQKMPRWVDEAFADYAGRFPPEMRLVLKEARPEPRSGRDPAALMAAEAARLSNLLPARVRLVALDERGSDLTSTEWAKRLADWRQGGQDVAFLIGGPDGLAPELKDKASERLRLSSLTLPHGLVRVLLAEQLYRAYSILSNHPYHRA